MVDGHNPGEMLKVFFDLRGREWNDKYFTNLNAWKIEKVMDDVVIVPPPDSGSSFPDASTEPVFDNNADDDDDLPF